MTTEELRERWLGKWLRFGKRLAGNKVFYALTAAYTAPDRYYHTLDHVADCLILLDACKEEADDPEAIEMALWFHDAIYDTHAADNEEQSAQWAVREIRGRERADAIARLILATKHGAVTSSDTDECLIADIDLAILGAEEAKFWAYEDAIRREYAWVHEEIFRSKRAEILRRFLERERLYQTPLFHEKYDKVARKNLSASIDRLSE
jgi:predicted metal-dependent HD superfamily phosphohydrolase